ncbi:uncharacterized protein LOC120059851 [Salvelinus namaycush]|uniref:Uncharacterized protein LOC120059851 n=1 Tax=Salvelinus namaycush TaxID=8040 RepID=A0A8U1BY37_SALNM|nr:uncharacterized protein LOC120059851 [Salvelinus namaycush]
MAAGSGWSEPALLVYRRGLNRELQTELACRGDLMAINQNIRMSISIGNLLVERRPIQSPMGCESSTPFSRPPRSISPEPIQLGHPYNSAPLTPAERHWRLRENLCLYYGESNHLLNSCPIRPLPHKGVTTTPPHTPWINVLDGQHLRTGLVTRMTESITLKIGLLHSEVIQLMVLSSSKEPLLLGSPLAKPSRPCHLLAARGTAVMVSRLF